MLAVCAEISFTLLHITCYTQFRRCPFNNFFDLIFGDYRAAGLGKVR